MRMKKVTGLALATTAAALFATAPMIAQGASQSGDVKCMNVNACKGKSDCKTENSSCKGHNECKGKGFVKMSKSACDAIGGTAG